MGRIPENSIQDVADRYKQDYSHGLILPMVCNDIDVNTHCICDGVDDENVEIKYHNDSSALAGDVNYIVVYGETVEIVYSRCCWLKTWRY